MIAPFPGGTYIVTESVGENYQKIYTIGLK